MLALMLPVMAAKAQDTTVGELELRPYISASIGHSFIDVSADNQYKRYIADEFPVFTLNAGFRLHDYIGVEAGVFRSLKKDADYGGEISGNPMSGSTSTHYYGYYADLTGYLPLSYITEEKSNLEFLGSIGFSNVTIKWEATANIEGMPSTFAAESFRAFGADSKDDDNAVRYGLGVQYHISESFSAKAMFRYIDVDFDGGVSGGQIVDIGVDYKF
jgi:opacity protein-like surface antigen